MSGLVPHLGLGIGWRPELALAIDRRSDLGFVEVIADSLDGRAMPDCLELLNERGLAIVPHGISLSLGSAEGIDRRRVRALAEVAALTGAPLVSEHVAFVRAGGQEAGHLLPVPRTREMLDLLVENIRSVCAELPVPLAVENIAALMEWPDAEFDEPTFLREIIERTSAWLLLDVANVYANCHNHGWDTQTYLDRLPLERVAYAHVAGGWQHDNVYHDTHAHPVPPEVLDLLAAITARTEIPGVMLERDDGFSARDAGIDQELDALAAAMARGREHREACRT
jgi:uncharacterized protein (UPF0276 family)